MNISIPAMTPGKSVDGVQGFHPSFNLKGAVPLATATNFADITTSILFESPTWPGATLANLLAGVYYWHTPEGGSPTIVWELQLDQLYNITQFLVAPANQPVPVGFTVSVKDSSGNIIDIATGVNSGDTFINNYASDYIKLSTTPTSIYHSISSLQFK